MLTRAEISRRYREKHRQELNARMAIYRAKKKLDSKWVEHLRLRERERSRKRRLQNPELCKRRIHESNRRRLYGLEPLDFQRLLENQEGCCAICRAPLSVNSSHTHVDHCHKSGRVRGVLCRGCNCGLGHFADDPNRLQAAIRYLEVS